MGRTGSRIPPVGLTWDEIKSKLETAGNVAIVRGNLEYPTEDVSFAYLLSIEKARYGRNDTQRGGIQTIDAFTDKAIEGLLAGEVVITARADRFIDVGDGNTYWFWMPIGYGTADFEIAKRVDGSHTELAHEAVDLNDYNYVGMASISGSTLKFFREDLTTPKITATDTTFASGYFGVFQQIGKGDTHPYSSKLVAPSTALPQPSIILEYEITGDGSEENPIRPAMPEDLVEVDETQIDAETWAAIQSNPKGQNGLPLINKLAVTWGAFDYKEGEPTMLVVITRDNPYQSGAILKQIEHAKSKNLKVLKPPRDYSEAIEQYRQLKQKFTEWIAGAENYCYQMLGHPDIEPLAVADFYYGEVIEHRTHYKQLKRVPEWEMERTLNMWNERIKRVTAVPAERKEKHQKKMSEILKKGW